MFRATRPTHILSMLPKWMRTAKQNEEGTLPPRDFALKEKAREHDTLQAYFRKEGRKQAMKPTPLNIKEYSLIAFSMIVFPYAIYTQRRKWKALEEIIGLNIDEDVLKSGDLEALERHKDPNRPPWPLLHFTLVEMREGKRPLDQLQEVWDNTKIYYAGDWLLAAEIAQILKYQTGTYLSSYLADPEQMRKEVREHLLRIKHAKRTRQYNNDVKEIVTQAAAELKDISFARHDGIVPKNT
jgi:hypothetical protein